MLRTTEQAATYDAQHPLPHPGYRAGQVWADDMCNSVVLTRVRGGWVYADGSEWTRSEMARDYPYLMADPACPHLAPWSPAEGAQR